MSYTKTTWVNNSSPKINATNLNNIENQLEKISNGLDYSTTEIDTGKKWINNKPIYKKVVDIGNLPNATLKTVAHGISNIGLIITIRGFATSGTEFIPLPFTHSSSLEAQVQVYASGDNINVRTGNDRSSSTGYVILEYTKTTD